MIRLNLNLKKISLVKMENKVYFNPRCSKCRIAEKFMDENNIEHNNYLYLEDGVTREDIEEILNKGNLNINQILRTRGSGSAPERRHCCSR